jgi:hypothetical protein
VRVASQSLPDFEVLLFDFTTKTYGILRVCCPDILKEIELSGEKTHVTPNFRVDRPESDFKYFFPPISSKKRKHPISVIPPGKQ